MSASPAGAAAVRAGRHYACPMRCEGDKVYGVPGRCPLCGMTLKDLDAGRYSADVTAPDGAVRAGAASHLHFELRDPSGAAVTDLEVVHEKLLHLLVVSKDLSWFTHVHPVRAADGAFDLDIVFPHPGEYVLYHDFTPVLVGQQVVPVTLAVPGGAPAPVALEPDGSRVFEVGGVRVELTIPGPIVAGSTARLRYLVMRGNEPVTDLEPFLGAPGHLVVIKSDHTAFVHSHPRAHVSPYHGIAPAVLFDVYFKEPGRYKSWAQFQRAGKVITVPYVFDVAPAEARADLEPAP